MEKFSSIALQKLLLDSVEQREIFTASWGIAEDSQIKFFGNIGNKYSIYDLASLTKPLVTTLLSIILYERNILDLHAPISKYLPEFSSSTKTNIFVWQLLTHCAGFPAWLPFYIIIDSPRNILFEIANLELEYEPGKKVIYSDIGFILLGILLERLTKVSLDRLFLKEIAEPLGLRNTCFNPSKSLRSKIAPTEFGNKHEQEFSYKVCINKEVAQKINKYDQWRDYLICGEVHDANAYFLGGVAGHAGLFGSVEDAFVIALQFLTGSRLIKGDLSKYFSTSWTFGLDEERSLGWMLASTKNSSAGEKLSKIAFGHTGFTGTSLWIDPEKSRIYILFTNRMYPIQNLNNLRRNFHNLSTDLL